MYGTTTTTTTKTIGFNIQLLKCGPILPILLKVHLERSELKSHSQSYKLN
jgi:hypothetical protein